MRHSCTWSAAKIRLSSGRNMEESYSLTTIEQTISRIPRRAASEITQAVRERWDSLTKPRGSLGVLEDSVVKLAEIQGSAQMRVDRPCIYVFCGDHGITEEGVSPYPSVVTGEMV